jgi:hypothetical protein
MDETFRKVEQQLRSISARRNVQITPDTEIYRDLGIYGDDAAFDVVIWATEEFGMEGIFHLWDYVPGERTFFWLSTLVEKLLGRKERQYKSFTVRDLVSAIEAKRWPDTPDPATATFKTSC